MDLEKIKSSVKEVSSEMNEEQLKENILTTLKAFYKFTDVFQKGWRKKMIDYVEEFLSSCKNVLQEHEFTVTRTEKTEEVPEGTILSGEYQGAKIEISNINYDSKPMIIDCGNEEPARFFIGTPKECPNYYLWKEYVDICGTKLCTLEHNAESVYRHFVGEDTCIDELYVIQDEIDGNINHYKRGIFDIEFVQLVIYNGDRSIIFHEFQEFWDAL